MVPKVFGRAGTVHDDSGMFLQEAYRVQFDTVLVLVVCFGELVLGFVVSVDLGELCAFCILELSFCNALGILCFCRNFLYAFAPSDSFRIPMTLIMWLPIPKTLVHILSLRGELLILGPCLW